MLKGVKTPKKNIFKVSIFSYHMYIIVIKYIYCITIYIKLKN
mgnify:CR=1 FL=1